MLFENTFKTLDVPRAQRMLPHLHEQVVAGKGRVELTSDGVDGTSVIISKEELQSLEHALAILSDSPEMHRMCAALEKVAQSPPA